VADQELVDTSWYIFFGNIAGNENLHLGIRGYDSIYGFFSSSDTTLVDEFYIWIRGYDSIYGFFSIYGFYIS